MSRRRLLFSQETEEKCRSKADNKGHPVLAKSTKMGRQAAGSETTIEDTQPCVPSEVLWLE